MSGRGYGDPERAAETGDLAGQAITTSRVADHGGPHPMHENRQKKASRPAGLHRLWRGSARSAWLSCRIRRLRRPSITSPLCCCCQVAGRVFFEVGFDGEGVSAVVPGRMVVSGPGVAGPKSWRSGCELAALESEPFPGCPPRTRRPGMPGVGLEAGEDGSRIGKAHLTRGSQTRAKHSVSGLAIHKVHAIYRYGPCCRILVGLT